MSIDINSDVGEGAATDAQLIPLISSANIACGGHAGDDASMAQTVRLAIEYGVGVGAHPSFPDRGGFGRRVMRISSAALRESLVAQMLSLQTVAGRFGVTVQHVKAHGALYNAAVHDPELCAVIAGAVRAVNPGMIVVALAGSMAETFERMGLRVAREAFIDRGYTSRGTLVPRDQRNALLTEPHEAAFRAVRFARDGKVIAVDGTELSVQVDTLCIHSDTPGAALFARAVRMALEESEITVTRMESLV